jgi:hypothetical protein
MSLAGDISRTPARSCPQRAANRLARMGTPTQVYFRHRGILRRNFNEEVCGHIQILRKTARLFPSIK